MVHESLVAVAKKRAALDYEQGRLLLIAERIGLHGLQGHATFLEYVERLFDCGPRDAQERLRVARALAQLPPVGEALRDGRITWSKARELTRIAVDETAAQWVAAADGRSARQIEKMVSGRRPGDRPSDPAFYEPSRQVLRLELSPEALATWREARKKLQREAGGGVDDETALLLMARQVLGGPTDEGRASYQIAITTCDECGRAWQEGSGEQLQVERSTLKKAECDAQTIDVRPGLQKKRAKQSIPPAVRRAVMRRDGGRCVVPGCRNSAFVDLHHVVLEEEGGPPTAENLVVLCGGHHRAAHTGTLNISGDCASRVVFRHADGAPYGAGADPRAASVMADVFGALKNLGYRETAAKRALERARAHVGAGEIQNLDAVLRAALGALRKPACN